jgi:hypothetical protein
VSWRIENFASRFTKCKVPTRREATLWDCVDDMSEFDISEFRRIEGRDFHPKSLEVASGDKEYREVWDLDTLVLGIQRRHHFESEIVNCEDNTRDTWKNHEVGPWKRLVDVCCLLK